MRIRIIRTGTHSTSLKYYLAKLDLQAENYKFHPLSGPYQIITKTSCAWKMNLN
uniref:Uncharacterized protein n=1 Tax=Picea sitchensis TaxID=3332 RepID=A0A6B9XVE4_PICSI|nr:hypothetical protein Q903MT_gene4165 [Picea sitchensis]